LLGPILHGEAPLEYEELVKRFNLQSPTQAANLLITAKRMYARLLKAVVGVYARDKEEIEAEIQELLEILARERRTS
jgi:hypothetical protein